MVTRFMVRPDEEDPATYGVWDAATHGWRGRALSETRAREVAADLELQYDAHGPRPAESVRRLSAPRPVWRPAGVLEAWVRHGGAWFGRVRSAEGNISWLPAADLRPAPAEHSPGGPATRP